MIRRATFEMHSRWRTNAMLLFFTFAIASIPVFAQQDNGGCENALKQLKDSNKKLKSLPYVCPKALGAQLQSVLARIKDQTPNGYQFQKAVLHIETGSTTEIDAGVNLVVFTISYKHKKGLTQSMDSIFGLPEKKALATQLARLEALSSITASNPQAATRQQTAEDQLLKALNDAIDVASQVTVLPTDSVVAKVQFSISNEIDAGVSFVFLGGTSKASAGIDFTKTSVNSIEITLKKPAASKS
jgi:hypothetical protein